MKESIRYFYIIFCIIYFGFGWGLGEQLAHITNYILIILLSLFTLKKINQTKIYLLVLFSLTVISELILSFFYDTSNPNFTIPLSILNYLIFDYFFSERKHKLLFTNLFHIFLTFNVLPIFQPSSDILVYSGDMTMILRNVPVYIMNIFSYLSILHLTKYIGSNNNKSHNQYFLLLNFFTICLGLFFVLSYYTIALSAIISTSLSFITISIITINYLWVKKYFKFTFSFIFMYLITFIFNNNLLSSISKFITQLWWINNSAQGSLFTESYRTDFAGFMRCFLEHPLGTGFYNMQIVCDKYSSLNNHLEPHSLLVSTFLGSPVIIFSLVIYLAFNKNSRNSLIRTFTIDISTSSNKFSKPFLSLAKFTHSLSFILILATSEMFYKFPFI